MQFSLTNSRSIAAVAFATICGVAACSPAPVTDSGVPTDSPTAPTDNPTPTTDNPTPNTDGGGGGDAGTTLYGRLGGRAGISAAVDAIVARELMDPEIASYFYFQVTGNPPPVAGHPNVAQLKSCLVNQLANAAGGPEMYPGAPADNMGWQCRNMQAAHTGLRIPNSVFDRFVTIAAGVLMGAGVAADDIAVIGGVLNSTKPQVAQGVDRDGGSFIPPG